MKLTFLLVCLLGVTSALNVLPRRAALRVGAAALLSPAAPALAKSKASVAPNKPDGIGANARADTLEQFKAEAALIKGDKGSRGVASKDFDLNDTVVRNRKENGGLAVDKDGRKIVQANRNRTPEELGLKQWSGN